MAPDHSRNLLLRQLSRSDAKRVLKEAVTEQLDFKQNMLEQSKPVAQVYFMEAGVASLVVELSDGEMIEAGTVGNEGVVGLGAVLGASVASTRAICQVPGLATVLPARTLAEERERGSEWFAVLLRYANFVIAMSAQAAACNRLHAVEARMSRWLLMTRDRVDDDDFPMTQEFLAQMLGVARPTVNIAGSMLQQAGFIEYKRGRIRIINRPGLESAACECYQRIRDELARMLTP